MAIVAMCAPRRYLRMIDSIIELLMKVETSLWYFADAFLMLVLFLACFVIGLFFRYAEIRPMFNTFYDEENVLVEAFEDNPVNAERAVNDANKENYEVPTVVACEEDEIMVVPRQEGHSSEGGLRHRRGRVTFGHVTSGRVTPGRGSPHHSDNERGDEDDADGHQRVMYRHVGTLHSAFTFFFLITAIHVVSWTEGAPLFNISTTSAHDFSTGQEIFNKLQNAATNWKTNTTEETELEVLDILPWKELNLCGNSTDGNSLGCFIVMEIIDNTLEMDFKEDYDEKYIIPYYEREADEDGCEAAGEEEAEWQELESYFEDDTAFLMDSKAD